MSNEALRLADALSTFHNPHDQAVAAELRRQHEEIERLRTLNAEMLEALKGAFWRLKQYDYQAMEKTIARCGAAIAKAEATP